LFINGIEDISFGTSVNMKLFADDNHDMKLYSSFIHPYCDPQVVYVTDLQPGQKNGNFE